MEVEAKPTLDHGDTATNARPLTPDDEPKPNDDVWVGGHFYVKRATFDAVLRGLTAKRPTSEIIAEFNAFRDERPSYDKR